MFLYNTGIYIYAGLVRVAALFVSKARLMVRGRKGIFWRIREAVSSSDRIVWVHCASLGEFEQGRPVIEEIRKQQPGYKILLTFFSPSGYEVRKNYEGADYIFYLPYDTPQGARRFVETVRPEIAVFIKYEYWLNYLKQLHKSGTRTFIVSAIFRRDSVFFKWYGGMFRRVLGVFERLFVQNEESAMLLSSIGVDNVTVAGDTRFDRVAAIAGAARQIEVVERFASGPKVFVAGSTWPPDEELIARLIDKYGDVKFIIAPHEMDRERIARFVENSPRPAVLYTSFAGNASAHELVDAQVLVIDTIGILSSVYQYADYGYIGGGFGVGIHNTLEAATFGLPIAFGPNYMKFKEARELIEIGAALSVEDFAQLDLWFSQMNDNPQVYAEARAKALSYIAHNTGATAKFMTGVFGDS